MQEITDIVQIKHEVLTATAAYAFAGKLFEEYEKIPYDIIKGIRPQFRCCVYREREIVRQRVRMAMGKLPVDVLPELSGQEVRKGLPVRCNQHDPAGGSDRSEQMPQMR